MLREVQKKLESVELAAYLNQCKEIQYLKAEGSSTMVYLINNQKVCIPYNMLNVRLAMNNPHIVNVHRSYCINLYNKPPLKGSSYILENGTTIPISRRKMKNHLSDDDDFENFKGFGIW